MTAETTEGRHTGHCEAVQFSSGDGSVNVSSARLAMEGPGMSALMSTSPFSITTIDCVDTSPSSMGGVVLVELEHIAAKLVGSSSVDLAQNHVKRAMVCEALTRTRGNFTKAADLLGVRRQAIQHMVSRYDLRAWAANFRR